MPKKKPLQDRSYGPFAIADATEALQDGGRLIGRGRAAYLGQKYGFNPSFGLHQFLEDAFFDFQLGRTESAQGETDRERRDFLEAILKRTESLEEYFNKMSNQVHYQLHCGRPGIPDSGSWRRRMESDLSALRRAARNALKKQPTPKPGGGKPEEMILLYQLRKAYLAETGKNDRQTYRDLDESYSGNFFEFAKECFEIAGCHKSDSAMSKLIGKMPDESVEKSARYSR